MNEIECDNCHDVVNDFYYKSTGFTMRTCSISCMAEFMCKQKISHLKLRLDGLKKISLKFRAV